MRVPLLALLTLLVVGAAHAQLSFGPSGVSSPPINLVTVFKFIRDLWATVTGSRQESNEAVKIAPKLKAETRQAGGSDRSRDYDDDLNVIKSVILAANEAEAHKNRQQEQEGPKRQRGTKLNGQKIDTESPLTRAILLPKKKIVLGKWPIVYGVLNGLLLAAAIILAKPYFYSGETVVSKYEKDKKENEMYGGYSDEDMEDIYAMAVSVNNGYGAPAKPMNYGPPPVLADGQLSPMYSTHMMVVQDDHKKKPKLKYKLKGGHDNKHSSHFKLKGKSSEIDAVIALPPPSPLPKRGPPPHRIPPSKRIPPPPRVQHPAPLRRPSYGKPSPSRPKDDSHESKEDVPLNELHYYNPTVFVSDEPSSYACLERMVCMNPSRSSQVAQAAEAQVAQARSLPGEHAANPADLNFMKRRLDQAAAFGANHGDCSQYFCPPQLPTLNQEQVGDHYSPPPASNRHSPPANQFALPIGNQISQQYLAANHFSLGPENLNTQSSNEVQFLPTGAARYTQSPVVDDSASKEVNVRGDQLKIQQLQPVYQNENVQGNAPSIITSQHVLRAQLHQAPSYGTDIHRTQKVEDIDVSEEEVVITPPPTSQPTTAIRWIQAPRIRTSDYAKVNVQKTQEEEEAAAYSQHPKNFLRRSSQGVASVVAVPVPGREVKTTIIESESKPKTE